MKANIKDGATFDLFIRELKAQTSHLGGLMRETNIFYEERYWILGDFSCSSVFTREDVLKFIASKIFLLRNLEDMKTLVSQFIDEIIAREYRYVRDELDLKIYKKMCKEDTFEPGVIKKKILHDNYIVKFYFTTRVMKNERPVTMKLLRKIKMSKDEFLETFESKAKWDFGDVRIKYTYSNGDVLLKEPTYRIIELDVVSKRVLNRISEMLDNNPFFIVSENRGRAVAIKKKNMLCYLECQQRGGRSSFDYIKSVIYSTFIGDNFLARKILYYNPKTKTLSDVCNEDRG